MKMTRLVTVMAAFSCAVLAPNLAAAQLKAHVPANVRPAWNKGIQPIDAESYWNAVECGKQGGAAPACVFWDTGLCKNDDFTLAFYTPYKQVAHEVWHAVSKGQPAPTPNYAAAQRTRVILGITPVAGSKNPIKTVVIKRGARAVEPSSQSLTAGGGTFIFDFDVFAATSSLTIELVGQAKTHTCLVERAVLGRFR